MNRGRHLDRNQALEVRTHRGNHFASERAGLHEGAEPAVPLVPQKDVLLHDMRRGHGAAAETPLQRDALAGKRDKSRGYR